MLTRLLVHLSVLSFVGVLALPGPAGAEPTGGALGPQGPQRGPGLELVGAKEWPELLERDARLSFPATLRTRALTALENPDADARARARALLALGAARVSGVRGLLQSWAVEGRPIERSAAILGLGEMGPAEAPLLEDLVRRESGPIANVALLALYKSGSPAGRALISELADSSRAGLSDFAAMLEILDADPAASAPIPEVRQYLDMRWEAARAWGLVDGRSWSAWLTEELGSDEGFLDGLVYRGAARLRRPGISDHYLEALFEDTGVERVRGALANMPSEISRIVQAGVWEPEGSSEWNAMLVEIDRQHSEEECRELLRAVRLVPGLSTYAAVLLVRAGSADGLPLVELDLLALDPTRRALVVRTLGDSGIRRYILTLEPMLEDPDPRVRAETLVAMARLEHEPALRAVQQRLRDVEAADFPAFVGALCGSAQHPSVLADLVALLPRLAPGSELRTTVAIALAGQGRIGTPRWDVKAALAAGEAKRSDELAMIRVIGDGADQSDLELVRSMFPAESDLELNVELTLALVRNRDPVVLPLLRKALWVGPESRSLLAGALIVDIDGIDSLRTELAKPPADSTSEDVRRVGFALGQWGGIEEVERLARRTRASDPALQGALLGALAARTF